VSSVKLTVFSCFFGEKISLFFQKTPFIMVSITLKNQCSGSGVMFTSQKAFISDLKIRKGKSENTCLSYERDLRQLSDWLLAERNISDPASVTTKDLADYEAFLKAAGKKPATISRSVASLKAYFQYLLETGRIFGNPAQGLLAPKVIRRAPAVLSDEELERLRRQPEQEGAKGIRDRAMLELLCDTGLRVSELLGIRVADLNLKQRTVFVSGSRTRSVPLSRKTAKMLERWMRSARQDMIADPDEPMLFVNVSGEPMTRQGFWKLLKKYGRDAGISMELTPHVIRHSFAASALRSGEDVRRVQSILGHSDIATTNAYLD